MVTEEHPNEDQPTPAFGAAESREMAVPGTKGPVIPKGMTDDEAQALRDRAADVVSRLQDASGSEELEMIDSVTSVGMQAQRGAGTELDLLKARVGDMVTKGGPGAELSKDLVDLRVVLNRINPHAVSEGGFLRRVFSVIPFVGKYAPASKVIEKIAIRYESASEQVGIIETKLREGRGMLVRDNVELRKLYEQVEAQQLPIQKNAYLGELLMGQLDELLERTDDPIRRERILNAFHGVSMRVQDLRTMEEVHIQFFVSVEMTRQNNARLRQSVERTLVLGTNVVMIGLAIQSALSRQKRVLEATQRTREFLGNLIVANAASIKQHTAEIGDAYNNPVIALEKITQAHGDLIEAMNIADRLKQEGIDSARENIAKLSEMSADLDERSRGLREQGVAEPRSIEA